MTLKELVAALEEPLRLTLSYIEVTFDGQAASAMFTFRASIPARLHRPAQPISSMDAEEEKQQMPRQSLFSGDAWTLHPGRTYTLSLDTSLEEQCDDLHRSALLGNLRIERVQNSTEAIEEGHPLVSWTIMTHAGSERERLDWGRDVLQRNLFRLVPPDQNRD